MEGSSSTGRRRSKEDIPNYKLMKKLGNGSFGQVNLATHILTGIKVAIKIFNKRLIDNSSVAVVNREINILRLFRHPHIVRFYEVIETKLNIYVVMEHVALGQLYDYIEVKGRLEEDEARRIFQQIISGVECCHRKGVIHRDLKPENLLLDSNNNVKIADFGLSNVTRDGHFFKRSCGSPNYAAPEVIAGRLYAGPEVDVWSCGVILYALLSGFLPFDDDDISRLFMKIKNGVYKLPYHLSSGAQDLITRMLIVDPIDRISIHEIQKHPWFQDKLLRNAFLHISDSAYHVNKIDDNIVQEAVKLGYNRQTVVESLQNSLQNQANVTYFLLLDNHSQVNKGDLHDELQLQLAEDEIEHPGTYLRSVPSGQQNWALGFQSESSPQRTMAGVLKILEALEVKWKKIGHYNLKCIWLPQSLVSSEITPTTALDQTDQVCSHQIFMNSGNTVFTKFQGSDLKFEIQLYKTKEKMYVLDVQKIDGPPILFLEMCAAFRAQALA